MTEGRLARPYGPANGPPGGQGANLPSLGPAERALHTAKRKEIYERLYPHTKPGVAQGLGMVRSAIKKAGGQVGPEVDRAFVRVIAKATGLSDRTAKRDAARGKQVKVLAEVRCRLTCPARRTSGPTSGGDVTGMVLKMVRHPSTAFGPMSLVHRDHVSSDTADSFNSFGAMYAARGFHFAAGLFGIEGSHLQLSVRNGMAGYSANLREQEKLPPEQKKPRRPVGEVASMAISAVVLEALALELVLKVRLYRAGKTPPKSHNLATLFAKLPASERREITQRFRASRQPGALTLGQLLAYSAEAFEQWRYMHEHERVEASVSDMREAFDVLAYGL